MPIPFTCPHCGIETNVADEYAGQSGPCSRCGKTIDVPTVPRPTDDVPLPPPPSRWPTPVVLLLAVVLVVFLQWSLALLLPSVQVAREAARRSQCSNNLKQLALAVHNYHDAYGCFPPAYIADEGGRPMHSWRVLILPFLECGPLYEQYHFDEPWNSPGNRALADLMPEVYRCPSEPPSGASHTGYAMIVGPGTLFDGAEVTRFRDILDGTSNTVLFVEVSGTEIHWMEPRDLDLEALSLRINNPAGPAIRSHHPGGVNAAFCDGSVRFLSETIDPELLRNLITRADGNPVGQF